MTDLLDGSAPSGQPYGSIADPAERAPRPPVEPRPKAATDHRSLLVDRHLAAGGEVDIVLAPTGRTVIVVPHPDDEALAAGGLIAHQRAQGRDVVVVAVTDGDAAYPDWRGGDLARVRRREQLEALHVLGVGRQAVHRIGLPDGTTDHHVDDIVGELLDIVVPSDTLVAPAVFDWHPDHEACGRAGTVVARETGCALLGSLFWAHHHPDHAPPGLTLGVLALSDDEVDRRRAAIQAHRSQIRPTSRTSSDPILSDARLGLLDRPVEYYVLGD